MAINYKTFHEFSHTHTHTHAHQLSGDNELSYLNGRLIMVYHGLLIATIYLYTVCACITILSAGDGLGMRPMLTPTNIQSTKHGILVLYCIFRRGKFSWMPRLSLVRGKISLSSLAWTLYYSTDLEIPWVNIRGWLLDHENHLKTRRGLHGGEQGINFN